MIRVQVDTRPLAAAMTALEQKQFPFAVSTALNLVATGKTRGLSLSGSAQEAERNRIVREFTIRKPEFVLRQGVKVLDGFATKARPSITLGMDDRADFLVKFEDQHVKLPLKVGGSLAVPVDVKRNKRDIVTTANRPKALLKDRTRFFIVKPGDTDPRVAHLKPGIYGRYGRGRERLRLMYLLEPEVPIDPVLEYAKTMEQAVTQRWTEAFRLAFAQALATAR